VNQKSVQEVSRLRSLETKVQGALDVHFVSPVPAVLEPRAHFTRKVRFHAASKRVRQSAPRAVKSHIACSAFVTRCIEAMLRASWKKTVGYCWRTQKCRLVG